MSHGWMFKSILYALLIYHPQNSRLIYEPRTNSAYPKQSSSEKRLCRLQLEKKSTSVKKRFIRQRQSSKQEMIEYCTVLEYTYIRKFTMVHGVWKSQEKSHLTLRAKRAMFTFWVDKSSLKMPILANLCDFLKTWSSLWSNSVNRQVSRTKISGKCQNSKIQMRHF